MNLHIPQSLQTHEELKQITLVQTQIISPGTSSPSMGIIQDTLIGGYLLTANDNKIRRYQMNNLMMFAKNFNGKYPEPAGIDEDGQEYWNGKQLYSLILPDLNIKENNITIVRGEIVEGFLDKTMLGRDAVGLIKQIYNSYGAEHTKNFFNDTEKLVTRWMMGNSFSIGFGDCILTETQREEVKNVIRTNINAAYELIKKAHNGIYMPDLDDKYKLAQLETDMTTILSKVDEKVKEYLGKNINKKNNLYIMSSKVGSAGSDLPMRQIMASVGPQLIWGERVSNGFTERTLPHYPRNDLSPEAKGFVRHSFIEGTDPSETFFIAMSGRTGTISTAIKTAESGYISRKLIKASEELKVNYDFTIRNSSNNIIQFCYGDDNMDPSKLEKISKIELIEFNNKKMLDVYQFDNFTKNYFEMFMVKDVVDKMMADENYKTILEDEFKLMMEYRDTLRNKYFYNTEVIGDINTFIPFNLYRIIPSIRTKFNIEDFHLSDITPQYVIDRFNSLMNDIMKYLPEKNNNWKLFIIIFKTLLSPKRILMEYRFTKCAYDYLLDLMKQKMIEALINPGELVGIIAAQTLGQNTTQLTLNSVEWNTEMLFRKNGNQYIRCKMGEFIDNHLDKLNEKDIELHPNDTTLGYIKDYKLEVLACDKDGKIIWDNVQAVTKHPVINKDGSRTLVKVILDCGREVIATKAKSFLKRVNNEIIGVDGEDLKVGDYLPVSNILPIEDEIETIDLSLFFDKKEYLFTSEANKALSYKDEYRWWSKHNGKDFIVPYSRSDSFLDAFLIKENGKTNKRSSNEYKDNCIYPKSITSQPAHIPEVLNLDNDFGFLCGAYLAEGCLTKYNTLISNIDENFLGRIERFYSKYNIKYHYSEKINENGHSKTNRSHCMVLTVLMDKLFGNGSENKRVHPMLLSANKEFLKGLIDGYFSGDGCVSKRDNMLFATSISKGLLYDIQQILIKFGIFAKLKINESGFIYSQKKYPNCKMSYDLVINTYNIFKFRDLFSITIDYKQERLNDKSIKSLCDKRNVIPNVLTKQWGDVNIYRDEIDKYILECNNEEDKKILLNVKNENIFYSKIVKLEDFVSDKFYVYDLTVENTKNFNIYNGLACRDTFHTAGSATGSAVITDGLPRLLEIINLTKNIKNSNMRIYLKDQYSTTKEEAQKVRAKFTYTKLKNLLTKSEILFDNKNGMTDTNEDREFIRSYKDFTEYFGIDVNEENSFSPWILRLIFDKESMMNRKITVQEVQEIIKENSHNDQDIECIFSDDSSSNIVMRIRIKHDGKGNFLDFMKDFEKQLIELTIRGIDKIESLILQEENIIKYSLDGSLVNTKEWVLNTNGSNIIDIMCQEAVDVRRTTTNNILEFYEIFGIEATRSLLYAEIKKIFIGSNPNPRHIQMFADLMTYRGKLMTIDRHGVNKNPEIGPIGKASFEEVMNIFTKSALFAEKDNMKGVSANILAGQFCPAGTNNFELMIDEEKIIQSINETYEEEEIIEDTDVDRIFQQTYGLKEDYEDVNEEDFEFGFGLENNKKHLLNEGIETNVTIVNDKSKNVEKIVINEKNLEEIPIEPVNYSQNVDFDAIEIEDPTYKEQNKTESNTEENTEVKTEEKKEKKIKIVRKKK